MRRISVALTLVFLGISVLARTPLVNPDARRREGREHGPVRPLQTTPDWVVEGNQVGAEYGFSVASAGDVNGDSYGDVIVGAYRFSNGETEEGAAFVYLGSDSGLSITPAWMTEGDQDSSLYGCFVSGAGDVNGDSYADVVVSAVRYDNGQQDEGRAYLFLGGPGGLSTTPAWTAEGNQADARFSIAITGAGDVNGDSYDDVIVGAYRYNGRGRAYVYLGSDSGLAAVPAWTVESDQEQSRFGFSVAGAGDVNGDSYDDVLVGADTYDNGETDEGRAFVYLGSDSGLSATPAWVAESNQAGARFGVSVARAGDVNGDSYDDIIVGAIFYDDVETDEGAIFVYHGGPDGPSPVPDWWEGGDRAEARLGISVASAGDVNGDSYPDVIAGSYYYTDPEEKEGQALVYLGSAAGVSTAAAWTLESNQLYAHLGYSVASAGDVNGDQISDVIVGAYAYANGEPREGRAYVFHGARGLPTGRERATLFQNHPNPFNATTHIPFWVDRDEHVTLVIYDVAGALVTALVDRQVDPGMHLEAWDGRDAKGDAVASGVYFYRLTAGATAFTRKAVHLK